MFERNGSASAYPTYRVTFWDSEWAEICDLERSELSAFQALALVEEWTQAHAQLSVLCPLFNQQMVHATYVTVEVYHGEK